ncbi:MAG TPA: hypothetical protein VIH52_03800 [Candidatus Nanoarchaeia archaeon]|nr:hypothetical protein [uncultured archaeon]
MKKYLLEVLLLYGGLIAFSLFHIYLLPERFLVMLLAEFMALVVFITQPKTGWYLLRTTGISGSVWIMVLGVLATDLAETWRWLLVILGGIALYLLYYFGTPEFFEVVRDLRRGQNNQAVQQ